MGKLKRVTAAGICGAAVFVIFYCMLGSTVVKHGRQEDFSTLYTGAYLARHGRFHDLYNYEVHKQVWLANLGPDVEAVPYTRPPFYALAQSPIALLPLTPSFAACIGVSLLLVLGFLIWAAREYGEEGLVLAAMCIAPLLGVMHGQDSAVVLTLLAIAYWLGLKGRDAAAGAVFGLVLFKFHLLLGIAAMMVATRRWRMLGGFAVVGALEGVLSLALIGIDGVRPYIDLVRRSDSMPPHPIIQKMPNLMGIATNLQLPAAQILVAIGSVLVLAVAIYSAWGGPWWRVYLAGMAASLLISPHIFLYDVGILLPALPAGYLHSPSKFTRAACCLLCSPLPFMAGFANPPWPAGMPISFLLLLAALAHEAWTSSRSTSGAPAIERPLVPASA